MRGFRFAIISLVAALTGCHKTTAAHSPKSLLELAAGWSADVPIPTCHNRGPRGEYLGDLPNAQYCQWPTITSGRDSGSVGGHRNSQFGLTDIMWSRRFRSLAVATRFRDSLSRELIAQGLQERDCRNGGKRWETKNLGVEFSRDTVRDVGWIATVFATILPDAIPPIFCPKLAPSPIKTT